MKRSTKIWLGIASFWPFVWVGIFMLLIFGLGFLTALTAPSSNEPPASFFFGIMIIFPLHLLTVLGMMALSVYYIIHLIRSEKMTNDQKVLWAVLLFIMNMLVLPIYWYFNIWKEPEAPGTTT